MKPLNQAHVAKLDQQNEMTNFFTARLTSSFCMLLILISFLFSSLVHAQSIAESFGGFSKKNNEPIKIEADALEVVDEKKIAIFTGNVKVVQGKFQLVSKKLKVTYSGGAGGQKKKSEAAGIKRIDASGKVAITTPDNQSATADWAKFDVLAKIVTIGGNVVLSQSGNVMRGDTLVIDLNTGRSKFRSTSTVTSAKKGKRPRISGVFFPGKSKGLKSTGKKKVKTSKPRKIAPGPTKPPLPWQNKVPSGDN